jgi:hypothetical protein
MARWIGFIAEVIEDHIRERIVDAENSASAAAAAEELIAIVHSYLTYGATAPPSGRVKCNRPEFDALARQRIGRRGRILERTVRRQYRAAIARRVIALQQ